MRTFNIYEAKTHFSKLLELVQNGEQVVIAKNGKPIADLSAHQSSTDKVKRKEAYGSMAGQFHYDDKYLVGIDPDIQEMFYGKDWDK